MYLGDKTNLVASMIDFMGELPEEWKVKYEEMRRRDGIEWEPLEGKFSFFIRPCICDASNLQRARAMKLSDFEIDPEKGKHAPTRLERRFEEDVKDGFLKDLLPVIRGLMQFKAEDRISATEALEMVRGIEKKYAEEYGKEKGED